MSKTNGDSGAELHRLRQFERKIKTLNSKAGSTKTKKKTAAARRNLMKARAARLRKIRARREAQ